MPHGMSVDHALDQREAQPRHEILFELFPNECSITRKKKKPQPKSRGAVSYQEWVHQTRNSLVKFKSENS